MKLNGLHNYHICTADELRMFWKVCSQGQNDVYIKLLFPPFVLHNITPIMGGGGGWNGGTWISDI